MVWKMSPMEETKEYVYQYTVFVINETTTFFFIYHIITDTE